MLRVTRFGTRDLPRLLAGLGLTLKAGWGDALMRRPVTEVRVKMEEARARFVREARYSCGD